MIHTYSIHIHHYHQLSKKILNTELITYFSFFKEMKMRIKQTYFLNK